MNKLAADYYQLGVQAALHKLAAARSQMVRDETTRQALQGAMPGVNAAPLQDSRKNRGLLGQKYKKTPQQVDAMYNTGRDAVIRARSYMGG